MVAVQIRRTNHRHLIQVGPELHHNLMAIHQVAKLGELGLCDSIGWLVGRMDNIEKERERKVSPVGSMTSLLAAILGPKKQIGMDGMGYI